jgi:hypothetical protein
MVFIADDGNEYPLIDESNDASLLNKMVNVAEKAINGIKEEIWKKC